MKMTGDFDYHYLFIVHNRLTICPNHVYIVLSAKFFNLCNLQVLFNVNNREELYGLLII